MHCPHVTVARGGPFREGKEIRRRGALPGRGGVRRRRCGMPRGRPYSCTDRSPCIHSRDRNGNRRGCHRFASRPVGRARGGSDTGRWRSPHRPCSLRCCSSLRERRAPGRVLSRDRAPAPEGRWGSRRRGSLPRPRKTSRGGSRKCRGDRKAGSTRRGRIADVHRSRPGSRWPCPGPRGSPGIGRRSYNRGLYRRTPQPLGGPRYNRRRSSRSPRSGRGSSLRRRARHHSASCR